MRSVGPFISGWLFAVGLGLGHMTQAEEIRRFLRFGSDWHPGLLMLMLTAAAVFGVVYRLSPTQCEPGPTHRTVDARLIVGAVVFGLGWGTSGLCPGPALVNTLRGSADCALFLVGMFLPAVIVSVSARLKAQVLELS